MVEIFLIIFFIFCVLFGIAMGYFLFLLNLEADE